MLDIYTYMHSIYIYISMTSKHHVREFRFCCKIHQTKKNAQSSIVCFMIVDNNYSKFCARHCSILLSFLFLCCYKYIDKHQPSLSPHLYKKWISIRLECFCILEKFFGPMSRLWYLFSIWQLFIKSMSIILMVVAAVAMKTCCWNFDNRNKYVDKFSICFPQWPENSHRSIAKWWVNLIQYQHENGTTIIKILITIIVFTRTTNQKSLNYSDHRYEYWIYLDIWSWWYFSIRTKAV